MKKIFLLALTVIMIGLGNLNAQTPAKQAVAQPTTKTVHTTKSGAPDKRFKENKTTTSTTTKTVGPTKKDGTPDMRYKANKEAKAAKPAKASRPVQSAN